MASCVAAHRPAEIRSGCAGACSAPERCVAVLAFAGGRVAGRAARLATQQAIERFAAAWARGDYAGDVQRALAARAQHASAARAFSRAYQKRARHGDRRAASSPARPKTTATPTACRSASTRASGATSRATCACRSPTRASTGRTTSSSPGLRRGEHLAPPTRLPPRATLLARDKTRAGPRRGPHVAARRARRASIVGALGPIPPERREELEALGVPTDAQVGVSGLERIFDERLLGRPGGELRAGGARSSRPPRRSRAPAVRTTISMPVQSGGRRRARRPPRRRRGHGPAHGRRCSPPRASRSPASSRRGRRSRSSPRRARSRRG